MRRRPLAKAPPPPCDTAARLDKETRGGRPVKGLSGFNCWPRCFVTPKVPGPSLFFLPGRWRGAWGTRETATHAPPTPVLAPDPGTPGVLGGTSNAPVSGPSPVLLSPSCRRPHNATSEKQTVTTLMVFSSSRPAQPHTVLPGGPWPATHVSGDVLPLLRHCPGSGGLGLVATLPLLVVVAMTARWESGQKPTCKWPVPGPHGHATGSLGSIQKQALPGPGPSCSECIHIYPQQRPWPVSRSILFDV